MDPVTLGLLAAIGFAGGFAGGLFGLGGGIVIVPLTTLLLATSFHESKAVALLAASFSTVPAFAMHFRAGNVRVPHGVLLAAGGIAGSLVAVLAAERLSDLALRAAFGIVLIGAAARLTFLSPKPGAIVQGPGWVVLAVGIAAGLASGFFGIGGGIVMVPALVLLSIPMHVAVGTSLAAVLVNSVAATGGHALLGYGDAMVAFGLPLAVGAVPGAYLGARSALRLRRERLQFVFALFLAAVGVVLVRTAV